MLMHREEILYIVESGKKNAENPIGLAPRLSRHTLCHLLLKHPHHLGYLIAVVIYLEEYLRRDIVGEVADDGKGFGEKDTQIEG